MAGFAWAMFLGALILFSDFLWAGDEGTTGAPFLKLGVGARGLAMGEAYSAMARAPEALFWNPARLTEVSRPAFLFSYNPLLDTTQFNQAALAFRVKKVAVGLGYAGLFQEPIDSYDDAGNKGNAYDAGDQLGAFGLASGSDKFSYGLGAKYFTSTIDKKSASVFAGDAGVAFVNPWWVPLRHALNVRNVGGKISFITQEDPLPLQMTLGNALDMGKHWTFGLDAGQIRGTGGFVSTGLEWNPFSADRRVLSLRGGYTTKRNKIEKFSGASFGFGFLLGGLSLDYAWIPYGELGDAHAVTFNLQIPKWTKKPRPQKSAKPDKHSLGESSNAKPVPAIRFTFVTITLDSGKKVTGEILRETSKKYLIKSDGRVFNVFKEDIIHIQSVPSPARKSLNDLETK